MKTVLLYGEKKNPHRSLLKVRFGIPTIENQNFPKLGFLKFWGFFNFMNNISSFASICLFF